ncbi:MAG TPA: tyrosinase family protein [Thermoanaerobaculia bacterium]|nr:tyrosinase family protein [Thermoanaerobaculia bacterium]
MAQTMSTTRYERVKEILERAAGGSTADYGGLGRFWELPLDELLEVKVHGVRMIAPAERLAKPSCCGHTGQSPTGDEEGEARPPYPGRGAASGFVQGLRGEGPFDGSRFPRLPWGGTAATDDDVRFISDWIDDGCPPEDREIASFDLRAASASTSLQEIQPGNVEKVYEVTASSNEYRYERGEVRQRMNIDCLHEDQREKLRFAFRELYELNKWPEDRRNYNNIALIHQNHCQHGWERFLPWHRIYLYEFEQALQDVCPGVSLPYWDWTMRQYRPDCPEKGWIIPKALQAFLTDASIEFLRDAKPRLPAKEARTLAKEMVGKHYPSQSRFFAEVERLIGKQYTKGEHRNRFVDALLAANSLWYPLRYPGEYQTPDRKPSTINKVIQYHYPTAQDMEQVMSLRSFRDFGGGSLYNDSFGFLDQNPHNTMHIWTGGMNPDFDPNAASTKSAADDLEGNRNKGVRVAGRRFHSRSDMYTQPKYGDMFSNLTAGYDPVFWPIHANIDRLWWEWQQTHSNSLPADLDSVLTPWSYTIADTIDMSRFGYEYVKSSYLIPVGLETPVGRFVSKPIDVPETVKNSFQQAEVRLHRVPQLVRSCFIRVFLNLPDASAETSIEDPHYAGYLAVFGHGPCIGGPGHCELPPNQPRKFDLRPRSHNTPRNHRINVTNAARRLLDSGASSLQLTLVVIGVDYCEDSELLRLEGVSLNFLD